jgi:hypothetical protein
LNSRDKPNHRGAALPSGAVLKEVKSKPISVEVFSDDFSRDALASAQDARLALSRNSFIASTTKSTAPISKVF